MCQLLMQGSTHTQKGQNLNLHLINLVLELMDKVNIQVDFWINVMEHISLSKMKHLSTNFGLCSKLKKTFTHYIKQEDRLFKSLRKK